MVKKIQGLPFEDDKMRKLCKDCKLDYEETQCFLAVVEFILANSAK